MKQAARILNRATAHLVRPHQSDQFELARLQKITGWSGFEHYCFFKAVLDELFALCGSPRVLVCGVYRGLDLAILAHLASKYHAAQDISLTGVDLFSAEPCADWPAEKRDMSWEQAFGCPPPSAAAAAMHCPSATLVTANSVDYLAEHAGEFDFIYLDTSHDEFTVRRELEVIFADERTRRLILAGDDYSGPGNFECGVPRALAVMAPDHLVLADRIWLTDFHYS